MSFTNPAPGGTQTRTDQGVDWGSIRGNILAVAPGFITNIYQNLSGFGTTIIERISSGPAAGSSVYYGLETGGANPRVSTGQSVSAGQPVARGLGSGGIEVGFWNPSTGRAVGAPQFTGSNATPSGVRFRNLLGPSSGTGTQSAPTSNLAQLWIDAGGPPKVANIMAAIAMAESSGNAAAVQKGQPYQTRGWGLWQITPGNSVPNIGTDQQLLDPLTNARAAVAKYKSGGLSQWTTYTSGAYRSFLPGAANDNYTGAGPTYGGTRPSSSGTGGGGGSSGPDLNAAYVSLRDQPGKPGSAQDVSNQSPFSWFLNIWSGEWDALSSGVKTAGEAFGDATRLMGDTIKVIELLPWYVLRGVEFVIGFVLLWIGVKQSSTAASQASNTLGHITRDVVSATPLVGPELRAAQGRRMGRREGQREAARISARGSEIARRRRNT